MLCWSVKVAAAEGVAQIVAANEYRLKVLVMRSPDFEPKVREDSSTQSPPEEKGEKGGLCLPL